MSEVTPVAAADKAPESSRSQRRKTILVWLCFLCVLAADLRFFLLLPTGPWEKWVAFLLQALGIYAIGMGLAARREAFRRRGTETYDVDTEVVKHLPALKSLLVGISAFAVSFATAGWPLYF